MAELDQLRKEFRETPVNETWDLEHGLLQIAINSLGNFGGMGTYDVDIELFRSVLADQ